jgi:hypothetical protein
VRRDRGVLTDQEMRDRMRDGWRMGQPFTVCGNGSTLEATAAAREWLPGLVERYGIRSVTDAGAGDLAWIHLVRWAIVYRPFDLFPRTPDVKSIDITTEVLPRSDAILCRHVLNHVAERVPQTLDLFRQSGSRYLIATQYDAGESLTKQFQRLDLRAWLGAPLESTRDTSDEHQTLALWRIND